MKRGLLDTKKHRRCLAAALVVCTAAGLLFGCTTAQNQQAESDILTQKTEDEGRTPITVMVKQAFSISAFEKAVEEEFPDVDIVQVGNYTAAMSPDEYEARLKNDDLTDIIMTWPLSVGEKYWEDRLLDLSTLSITNRYNISMLNSIAKEGKLYYLPGPAQVRGIVYNKTLFEEKGWQVPKDYAEFTQLCQTIENSGIRSIQLGFKNAEVLDTAFIGYGYADSFIAPSATEWLENYEEGKGDFIDNFGKALGTFQQMIDAGIWKKEDLQVDYAERERLLFNRECAMTEDSVLLARKGVELSGTTDEFALMPFFNPGSIGNDWARLYMVCYIGLNKHLADDGNHEKYDKVMEIMDYISTPEGQEALAGDTGSMYSSLKGVDFPDIAETKDLALALSHARYAIFPTISNIQTTLRKGLAGMVSGEYTKEQVAQLVDEANRSGADIQEKPEVIGTASKDFNTIETGTFITDTMKAASKSEIALFLDGGKDGQYNHKGVTAKLYKGDLTKNDITRIMPDLQGGQGEMWKVAMTGEDLIKTLEYAITTDNDTDGWFYYFSGLKVEFNPTAELGKRVKKATLSDGSKIDLQKEYSIAVMENSVPEEYMKSCEKSGILIGNLLEETIRKQKTISPAEDGRFVVVEN